MDLNSLKKYGQQLIPFVKSDAQMTARAVVKQAKGKDLSKGEKALLDKLETTGEGGATDKLKAHVAIKLLSSREAGPSKDHGTVVTDRGNQLLNSLGAGETKALDQVFSHYQHKKTQRSVAGVALGASAITSLGTFIGAGPVGLVPLLVGVVPSATAFAKARKVGHRLEALEGHGITAKTFGERATAAKAAATPQQPTVNEPAISEG